MGRLFSRTDCGFPSSSLCTLMKKFNPLTFIGITDIVSVFYLPWFFCTLIYNFLMCPINLSDWGCAPFPSCAGKGSGQELGCRVKCLLGALDIGSPCLGVRCLTYEMGITRLPPLCGQGQDYMIVWAPLSSGMCKPGRGGYAYVIEALKKRVEHYMKHKSSLWSWAHFPVQFGHLSA